MVVGKKIKLNIIYTKTYPMFYINIVGMFYHFMEVWTLLKTLNQTWSIQGTITEKINEKLQDVLETNQGLKFIFMINDIWNENYFKN